MLNNYLLVNPLQLAIIKILNFKCAESLIIRITTFLGVAFVNSFRAPDGLHIKIAVEIE